MKTLRAMYETLCDFLWVLQAYLRGKVLRQKAYCPKQDGVCMSFRLPVTVTGKRLMTLMRWWGIDEAKATLMSGTLYPPPYRWTDGAWEVGGHWDDWGQDSGCSFIPRR